MEWEKTYLWELCSLGEGHAKLPRVLPAAETHPLALREDLLQEAERRSCNLRRTVMHHLVVHNSSIKYFASRYVSAEGWK